MFMLVMAIPGYCYYYFVLLIFLTTYLNISTLPQSSVDNLFPVLYVGQDYIITRRIPRALLWDFRRQFFYE